MSTDLVASLDRLDATAAATELRALSYDLLDLAPGAEVADVGCGTGRAVAELTDLGAAATGVDHSADMIDIASQRWPHAAFRVGTAERLPFADGQLRGYRADKLLHVFADPGPVVAEARRVLAPGGRIALLGQDWDAFVVDAADLDLTRRIGHALADTVPCPTAGRRQRNLLLDNGFTDVTVRVLTGVFTEPDLAVPLVTMLATTAAERGVAGTDDWLADQRDRARRDRILVAVPLFVTAGTRSIERHTHVKGG